MRLIEQATGRTAIRENLPMQPGEVPETCADVSDLEAAVGFAPNTPIADGVHRFVAGIAAMLLARTGYVKQGSQLGLSG